MIQAIAIDDEPLALKVIESLCNKTEQLELLKTFTEPNEGLKHLRKYPVDLVFVDINMPAINGINLVKAIEQNTMVIFTTAYSEYAAMSYELNAIDYLLKPINLKRFQQAVAKAVEFHGFLHKKDPAGEKFIFVRADLSLVKIPLAEILYIEGWADYLKIFVQDRKPIMTRMPMKEMLEKLPAQEFIRVHRSYILPLQRILSLRNNVITTPEKEIPVGKTYIEEIQRLYRA
jgi:DNA-binding LytR/AlgR family response regulator